jgi:hypothetical protein
LNELTRGRFAYAGEAQRGLDHFFNLGGERIERAVAGTILIFARVNRDSKTKATTFKIASS